MTLTDLIKSAEEKLANTDLTLGTRRREEAILHHLTNLERAVTELVSENTEMYVDLAGGVDYTVDTLIRHKWPEEKPPISGSRYLVLIDREYTSFIDILFWGGSDWVRFKHNDDRTYIEADDDVTHWWNLPEVGNE